MKRRSRMRVTIFVILLLLAVFISVSSLLAASPSPLKAKQEPESRGYASLNSHDEIVARAKKEGKVRALGLLSRNTYQIMINAFKKRYPFISEVYVEEAGATEAPQRFLLELKAGRKTDWDVFSVAPDFYSDYIPYIKKFDISRMAEQKVLAIPSGMIDPKNRTTVSIASSIHVIGYNKKLVPEEKVPGKWEDFLKPEFKGKKFMVDIRPLGFAALAAGLGEEWALDYAGKIAAQEPVWIRGQSRQLTGIAAGEYAMLRLAFYHSCLRAAKKDPTGSLGCKVIEPVPARIQNFMAVSDTASRPNASLLWIEFQATPEGQRIIDENEPLNSSIYAPGSALANVIQGKKVAANNWDTWQQTRRWEDLVVKAFGFPKAEEK
jgi:ABC-type Fe3+ transport system substrate-binding protein